MLLCVREMLRGMVERSNLEELREREVREVTLPLRTRLPRRGEPGSKEEAAPFAKSAGGKDGERVIDPRDGDACPVRRIGGGSILDEPKEDSRLSTARALDTPRVGGEDGRGEASPFINERPSSIEYPCTM